MVVLVALGCSRQAKETPPNVPHPAASSTVRAFETVSDITTTVKEDEPIGTVMLSQPPIDGSPITFVSMSATYQIETEEPSASPVVMYVKDFLIQHLKSAHTTTPCRVIAPLWAKNIRSGRALPGAIVRLATLVSLSNTNTPMAESLKDAVIGQLNRGEDFERIRFLKIADGNNRDDWRLMRISWKSNRGDITSIDVRMGEGQIVRLMPESDNLTPFPTGK
jgi:hypothetical protein